MMDILSDLAVGSRRTFAGDITSEMKPPMDLGKVGGSLRSMLPVSKLSNGIVEITVVGGVMCWQ